MIRPVRPARIKDTIKIRPARINGSHYHQALEHACSSSWRDGGSGCGLVGYLSIYLPVFMFDQVISGLPPDKERTKGKQQHDK